MRDFPFTLALGSAEADVGCASLADLAREICRRRDALSGQPGLKLTTAHVFRGEDGGSAVAVRVADGAHAGRGSLIGYAFLPGAEQPMQRLMAAIIAQPAPPVAEAA